MFKQEIEQHYNIITILSIKNAQDKGWDEYIKAYVAVKDYAEINQHIYETSSVLDKIRYRLGYKELDNGIDVYAYKNNLMIGIESMNRLLGLSQ